MKRIFLVFITSLLVSTLASQVCELKWNRPWLVSENHLSMLELVPDEDQIFLPELQQQQKQDSAFSFAFSTVSKFRTSLRNFFSRSDDSSLLYYRSQDIYLSDQLSSNLPAAGIPKSSMLKFSLLTGIDWVTRENKDYNLVYYGTRLSGYISQRLFLSSEWWAGHFSGALQEAETSTLIDSWTNLSDAETELYLDNISGRLTYRGKGDDWSLSLGRGRHQIGSNLGGSIILNDASNEYGYLSSKLVFKDVYFSYLHGHLIPDSTTINNLKKVADKYIAIHKIGWTPSANFEIFAGEEIIYANRSLDLSYLVPHIFWRATEHNLSDRDNAMIFLGANYKPQKNLLLYFNFLLDELKKSEILGNWWGNKYALQIGSSCIFDPARSGRVSLELTAVRPWVYTHYLLENRFSHDDVSLGFPGGSNLIQYTAELNYDLLAGLNFNTQTYYRRQGSVGNSFTINYYDRPSDQADWLEGKISDSVMIRPVITWQILAHHTIKAGYSWHYNRNADTSDAEIYLSYQAVY